MPKNALAPEPANALVTQPYFGNPNITAQGAKARAARGGPMSSEQAVDFAKTILGFTPVVGDVISGYDALQALRQGNYGEAALAGLGVLPLIPSMAKLKGMVTADRLASERRYYGFHDNTSKGILTMMPPQRFLDLSVEGHDVAKRAEQMKKFNVDKYNKEFLPYLDVDRAKGQVVSHEGRARAMRALMDDVPEIPVVIASRDARFKSTDELPSILKREKTGAQVDLQNVMPVELLSRQP